MMFSGFDKEDRKIKKLFINEFTELIEELEKDIKNKNKYLYLKFPAILKFFIHEFVYECNI